MNSTSIDIRNFIGRCSQIIWALLDQAMVSGVIFFTGIILVRFLGLEEFGRFTLTLKKQLLVSLLNGADQ